MKETLEQLQHLNTFTLFGLFFIENGLIAIIGISLGFWADGNFNTMRNRISKIELYWVFSTIFFNSWVTLAGYELFKYKIVVFHFHFSPLYMLLDFVLLVLLMDLFMYVFHRVIHRVSFIYKYHDLHHFYDKPTATSLFVLHPVEVVSFGLLWLLLITLFDFSFYATMIYLVFNVIMGLIGHVEKEFIPARVKSNRYLQWLATTSFHRDHHLKDQGNFGFYTNVWDRLFGTHL